jgi:hypothetical protein
MTVKEMPRPTSTSDAFVSREGAGCKGKEIHADNPNFMRAFPRFDQGHMHKLWLAKENIDGEIS